MHQMNIKASNEEDHDQVHDLFSLSNDNQSHISHIRV